MKDPQNSKMYQKVKNRLFLIGIIFDFIILIFFFKSGYSLQLKTFALQSSAHFFWINAVYISLFCLGMYIVHFPLGYFSGYLWEHKFKLSNQNFFQWMGDDLKKAFLSFIVILFLLEVIYLFLRIFPETWWIYAGSFWICLTFVIAKIVPNLIVPLFYKYSLIDNEDLRDRVYRLFQENQVALENVYSIDMSTKTKKANAMLCGMGKTRRVVLSDTLINDFSLDEIETVIAHEIGHYKHHDIVKLLIINAATIFSGLFIMKQYLILSVKEYNLSGIDDIVFLPMLLCVFMVFGLVITPLINLFSRFFEKKADHFSLQSTQKPEAFISMMDKLGRINLSEYHPSKIAEIFLYDHPPLYKRVQFANNFKKKE